MKEGEPVLGGPQANPGVTGTSNSGAQPIVSGAQASPVTEPVAPVAPQPAIPQSSAPQQNRYITQPPSHFTPQQPISSGTGDIVLNNNSVDTKKARKIIIIIAIAILIMAATAIVLLTIVNQKTKENSQNPTAFTELYENYYNLLKSYDCVDYTPTQCFKNQVNGPSFFIVDEEWLKNNQTNIKLLQENINVIKPNFSGEKQEEFNNIYEKITETFNKIQNNVEILQNFYDAFVLPAYNLMEDQSKATADCVTSEKASELINEESLEVVAAQKYQFAYCKINQIIYTGQDPDEFEEIPELTEAKIALVDILEDISQIETSESELQKFIMEELEDE